MSLRLVSPRVLRCRAVLVAFAALASLQPALAEIVVRDDGADGIVLANIDTDGEPAASAPRRGPLGPRPSAHARRKQFAPLVRAAARTHGLPEALLQALIEVESGFDAAAVSPKGALGLMQLMPATARALGTKDARDPAANLEAGSRYLKSLLARHGNDLALALAAYNAGPGAVQRSGGIPPFAETQAYVPRVIARYHQLQSAGD